MTINPGIAELLSSHDGLTTVKNSTFNPYSDYAFTGTDVKTNLAINSIVYSASTNTVRYSYRFSVYCSNWGNADGLQIGWWQRAGNPRVDTFHMGLSVEGGKIYNGLASDPVVESLSAGFHDFTLTYSYVPNQILTVNNVPKFNVWVNLEIDGVSYGKTYYFETSKVSSTAVYSGYTLPFFISFPAQGSFYVSNIMTDTRQIYSTEKVYSMPLYKTGGNMTEEDGFHIASNANDSLQMEVNYSTALADKVGGGKVRVTNVLLVGNPAYRVGDTLTKLSAAYKEGLSTVSSAMGTTTLQTNQDGVCTFSKALSNTVFYDGSNSCFANSSFIFTAS